MASLGNLYVNIGANTRALQTGLTSASTKITGFTSKTTGALSGLARSFGAVGIAATAAFAAFAVGTGLRKTITEFIEFENALLDLQKVLTDSEGDVKQYMGSVKALSSQFAVSSSKVLQGAANFKQAGFTVQQAFELQESALTLTRISELGVVEASEMLISALKGFDAPATQTTRLIDGMNEVSNKYATSLGQLSTGMAQLAPIAKLMGFSFEETAGILTPIIEVFRSGSEAANAMKMTLIRLTSSNNQVQEGLATLGVSQHDLNGKLKSGKQILTEVQEAFGGLAQEQKIVVAGQIAGVRQAAKATIVFGGLAKTTAVTATAMDSAGSAQKELDVRMLSLEVQLDGTKEAFRNMAIEIGSKLAPSIGRAAESITKFITALSDSGNLGEFAKGVGHVIDGFTIMFRLVADTKGVIDEMGDGVAGWIVTSSQEGWLAPWRKFIPILRQIPDELEISQNALDSAVKNLQELPERLQGKFAQVFAPGPMLPDTKIVITVDDTELKDLNNMIWVIKKGLDTLDKEFKVSVGFEDNITSVFSNTDFNLVREMALAQNQMKRNAKESLRIRKAAMNELGILETHLIDSAQKHRMEQFQIWADNMIAHPKLVAQEWERVSKIPLEIKVGEESVSVAMDNTLAMSETTNQMWQEMSDKYGSMSKAVTKSIVDMVKANQSPLDTFKEQMAELERLRKLAPKEITLFVYTSQKGKILEQYKQNVQNMKSEAEKAGEAMDLAFRTPFQKMKDDIKETTDLFDKGFIKEETKIASIQKIEKEYAASLKNMNKATTEMEKRIEATWDKLGDTMGDMMFAAWEGDMTKFGSVWKSFLKGLQQEMFRSLGKDATGFMRKLLSGGLSSAGGGGGIAGVVGKVKGFLGFHEGGFVKGQGDEVNALLQTGEGVLSRKQMKGLGGEEGFKTLQKMLGSGNQPMFHDGGIVSYHAGGHVEGGTNRSRTVGEPRAVGGGYEEFISSFESIFQNFNTGRAGNISDEVFKDTYSKRGGEFESFLGSGKSQGLTKPVDDEPLGFQNIEGSFGHLGKRFIDAVSPILNTLSAYMIASGISDTFKTFSGGGAAAQSDSMRDKDLAEWNKHFKDSTGGGGAPFFPPGTPTTGSKTFQTVSNLGTNQNLAVNNLGFLSPYTPDSGLFAPDKPPLGFPNDDIREKLFYEGFGNTNSTVQTGGRFGLGKEAIFHDGGVNTKDGLALLESGEGVLSKKDMSGIGGRAGFNAMRSGGDGGVTINVPVSVDGNNRLAVQLQRDIEDTVKRTIKEFS